VLKGDQEQMDQDAGLASGQRGGNTGRRGVPALPR
jgi:hypothetical protein